MKLAIGENIRNFRKKNDLTQEALADRLGVTYQSISRWENGTTYPDLELIPAKDFKIEYSSDGESWTELCPAMQTTTVGYKRIIPLNGKTSESYGNGYNAKKLRITILDSRACPLLSNLNVY